MRIPRKQEGSCTPLKRTVRSVCALAHGPIRARICPTDKNKLRNKENRREQARDLGCMRGRLRWRWGHLPAVPPWCGARACSCCCLAVFWAFGRRLLCLKTESEFFSLTSWRLPTFGATSGFLFATTAVSMRMASIKQLLSFSRASSLPYALHMPPNR